MAKVDIINKLNNFLSKHDLFTEECQVVYLMVQIRKIIEYEDTGKYQLIRFYCDWILHTAKDNITNEMKTIMNQIFDGIKFEIEHPAMIKANSPIMEFTYMTGLNNKMIEFFDENGIDNTLLKTDWINFIQLLVKIFENQPINKPHKDILKFEFISAASRCVAGKVWFTTSINGLAYYEFKNAY